MDKEIVKKAKNGDKEAFGKIVNQAFIKSLYVTARSKMKSAEDAKDIVQETLQTAYMHIRELKSEEKFKAWVRQILNRKIADEYKVDNCEYIEFDVEINAIGDDVFADIDKKIDLYSIINSLDESEKYLLSLYMNGYTSIEIGKIIHVRPDAVRARITRLKIKLKEEFGGSGYYEG